MVYRPDKNLEFLGRLESAELNDLVACLTANNKTKNIGLFTKATRATTKIATQVGSSLIKSELYKTHHPNHKIYWKSIAAEVQLFGANSLVSRFYRKGKGVKYREILIDVCNRMKVDFNEKLTIEKIEENLLMKILAGCLENIKLENLTQIADELGHKNKNGMSKATIFRIFQAIFKAGGFKYYMLLVTLANAAVGLYFTTNVFLTKMALAIIEPASLAITGFWTALGIASPAYRITIPVVIYIAALRKHYNQKLLT